jgi:cholesterol transport system auxiliary component
MNPISRRLLIAALAASPAGCASLLPTGGAPPKLYTLTPANDFPPDVSKVGWQLLIDVPTSAAALDTERIALSRSAVTIDYFADAAWTDRAPLLVQSLIVQSFENSGRIIAIARESLALQANYILQPELRHFEADYAAAGPPTARVEIGLRLVKLPERLISAQRKIEAKSPARENQMLAIVDAFNAALHQALRQIVDWTLAAPG